MSIVKRMSYLLLSMVGLTVVAGVNAGKPKSHTYSRWLRGMPVITSPYLGERSKFEAFDLVVNIAPVNQDLRLLEQTHRLEQMLKAKELVMPREPMVDLSGRIETLASIRTDRHDTKTNLELSSAELDVLAHVGGQANLFLSLVYDSDPTSLSGKLTKNSRIFVDQGFFTIGRLMSTPFYVSAGQLYVPFGQYNSGLLSGSMAAELGKVQQRALVVGFKTPGPYHLQAAVYGFKGDLRVGGRNQGGAQLVYHFQHAELSASLGAGVISNIAEANGFQDNGLNDGMLFSGFAYPEPAALTECIMHRVVGVDVQSHLTYRNFSAVAELVFAGEHFSVEDLMYNNEGAKPLALNVEGTYQLEGCRCPASVTLGYGLTSQAKALNVPKHRVAAAVSMAWLPSTLQTLEVSYEIPYANEVVAGRGDNHKSGALLVPNRKHNTVIKLHFGYYF